MRRFALFASSSLFILGLAHCVADAPDTTSTGGSDASSGDGSFSDGGNSTSDGGTTDGKAPADAGVDAAFVDSCIGFTDCPKNIESPHLQLWLRGNFGETCATGRLTGWTDQSGAGRDATLGVSEDGGIAMGPQCGVAKINNSEVVTFDAPAEQDAGKFTAFSDGTLQVDLSYLEDTDYTVIVVNERASDTTGALLATDGVGSALACSGFDFEGLFFFGFDALSSISTGTQYSQGCANGDYETDTFVANSPEVDELVFSEATGHQIFINGVQQYAGGGLSFDLSPLNVVGQGLIGRGNKITIENRYHGNIGEIIVYSVALTPLERSTIHNHLIRQWGVTF